MSTKLTLLLGTLLAVGAITATVIALGSGGSGTSSRPAAASAGLARSHVRPAQTRTLVVYRNVMPPASSPGTVMNAMLKSGAMPTHAVMGTVMTDTDCGADATGMSRCRNVVRMPGGHMMVVRHPHRMMDVPCMTPGEHVRVTPANT